MDYTRFLIRAIRKSKSCYCSISDLTYISSSLQRYKSTVLHNPCIAFPTEESARASFKFKARRNGYYNKKLSSLTEGHETNKIFHFTLKEKLDFSKLSPRQSAVIEDEIFSSLLAKEKDPLLVDPVLGEIITRRGLNWIRDVSIQKSFDEDFSSNGSQIVVNVQPPTLMHPNLQTIASNLSQVIQNEVLSIVSNHARFHGCAGVDREEKGRESKDVYIVVKMTPRPMKDMPYRKSFQSRKPLQLSLPALQNVSHFLAVYSCKGGVGKSTIAVNLAYQLASMGGRIGLLDLDVYGPSLPLLVHPDDPTVRKSPQELGKDMIEPIVHRGVKLMSLGFVSPNSGVPGSGQNAGAAVLRGPMAGRVAAQLLQKTNWGDLDVLLLDLPPGTGDVQLEVCQSLSLSGAVAVSTPSALAWSDVKKGVQMFGEMGVLTLALVENMAYFVCEGGGKHYPFGKSDLLNTEMNDSSSSMAFFPNPSHVFHLPISTNVHSANEGGLPLCSNHPKEAKDELDVFSDLANAISTELLLLLHELPVLSQKKDSQSGNETSALTVVIDAAPSVEFDVPFTQLSVDNNGKKFTVKLFSNESGYQTTIDGTELRYRDPKTGDVDQPLAHAVKGNQHSSQKSHVMVHHHSSCSHQTDEDNNRLFPAKIAKKGNYGYEISWADGAKVIYSLLAIAKAAGGKTQSADE